MTIPHVSRAIIVSTVPTSITQSGNLILSVYSYMGNNCNHNIDLMAASRHAKPILRTLRNITNIVLLYISSFMNIRVPVVSEESIAITNCIKLQENRYGLRFTQLENCFCDNRYIIIIVPPTRLKRAARDDFPSASTDRQSIEEQLSEPADLGRLAIGGKIMLAGDDHRRLLASMSRLESHYCADALTACQSLFVSRYCSGLWKSIAKLRDGVYNNNNKYG